MTPLWMAKPGIGASASCAATFGVIGATTSTAAGATAAGVPHTFEIKSCPPTEICDCGSEFRTTEKTMLQQITPGICDVGAPP